KQNELIEKLDKEFVKVQHRYHLAAGDFPNLERFKAGLSIYKFDKFSNLKSQLIEKAEDALSNDLPKLMSKVPQGNRMLSPAERNPFDIRLPRSGSTRTDLPPSYWDFSAVNKQEAIAQFNAMKPNNGKVSGESIKPVLMDTGLEKPVLSKIWKLADWDEDGYMDIDQFAVALHLCKAVTSGGELPEELPPTLKP
ncbi:5172_t:CDS:2, partial [Scutellospora calospora]